MPARFYDDLADDYDEVDRSSPSRHRYGERTRGERLFRLGQEWTWLDGSRYRTTMIVEELSAPSPHQGVPPHVSDALCSLPITSFGPAT